MEAESDFGFASTTDAHTASASSRAPALPRQETTCADSGFRNLRVSRIHQQCMGGCSYAAVTLVDMRMHGRIAIEMRRHSSVLTTHQRPQRRLHELRLLEPPTLNIATNAADRNPPLPSCPCSVLIQASEGQTAYEGPRGLSSVCPARRGEPERGAVQPLGTWQRTRLEKSPGFGFLFLCINPKP